MSGTRKPNNVRQREPLRVPTLWNAEDRAFVIQLNGQLDDIYSRIGKNEKALQETNVAVDERITVQQLQTYFGGMSVYKKNVGNASGNAVFTYSNPQNGSQYARYTALLLITDNGQSGVYTLEYKISSRASVTKLSGNYSGTITIGSSGDITVPMNAWSIATLMVDDLFGSFT